MDNDDYEACNRCTEKCANKTLDKAQKLAEICLARGERWNLREYYNSHTCAELIELILDNSKVITREEYLAKEI